MKAHHIPQKQSKFLTSLAKYRFPWKNTDGFTVLRQDLNFQWRKQLWPVEDNAVVNLYLDFEAMSDAQFGAAEKL